MYCQPEAAAPSTRTPKANTLSRRLKLAPGLFLAIIFCLYGVDLNAESQQLAAANNPPAPFYRQLQPDIHPAVSKPQSTPTGFHPFPELIFGSPPSNPKLEKDLTFNYLWMQQYQQGYRRIEGGAAIGKLLRIGAKSLYRSYSGSGSISTSDDNFSDSVYDLDYNLRLSGDKVKLGIEYAF